MNTFHDWWKAATPAHKARLAKLANTSVGQLGQVAGGHRVCSAALAGRIARGTTKVGPFPVLRSALCPACFECSYAKRCERR